MSEQKEPCYKRIRIAMELRSIKQVDLIKATGIPKSAMSEYISGKYIPKQTPTYLIAKALNVSEAWLMGYDVPMQRGEEIRTNITPEEKNLLDLFNQLDSEDKSEVQRYISDYLLGKEKYKVKKEPLNA